ncbi:MAG: hypothetical protein PHY29_05770 [Syntrophales bacterium]|nr:hypothetical protein [Syntrophales bacterium]
MSPYFSAQKEVLEQIETGWRNYLESDGRRIYQLGIFIYSVAGAGILIVHISQAEESNRVAGRFGER